MLFTNTTNRITFTVGVHGTAALPAVRCLIGEDPALCFTAKHLNADKWEVLLKIPADFAPGVYMFKVEVHLNGRLFTPINQVIAINPPVEDQIVATLQPKEPQLPAAPAPEVPIPVSSVSPAAPEIVSPESAPIVTPPRVDAVIQHRVKLPEAPAHIPAKLDMADVLKAAAEKEHACKPVELTGLRDIANKPVQAKPAPAVTQVPAKAPVTKEIPQPAPAPAPAPVIEPQKSRDKQWLELFRSSNTAPVRTPTTPPGTSGYRGAPVKVSIVAVANEAVKHEAPRAPTPMIKRVIVEDGGIPVSLIKGDIIFQ